VDVDELVGSAEIAQRLHARNAELVHDWRRRGGIVPGTDRRVAFPDPVARLKIGFVWHWPDVEKWARATGRL
jgi:hypothetical protein